MYRIVTGVGPHPTPFTVTSAPVGSEVIRNSPSVASEAATLAVSVCVGFCACVWGTAAAVASSMSAVFALTGSVAATSATAGASASGVGALAAVTGAGAGAAVPARYHAVATAATAPRTTRAAALDHNAVVNEDEPASRRGWTTGSGL